MSTTISGVTVSNRLTLDSEGLAFDPRRAGLENDTMVLAYRVQIIPEPSTLALWGLGASV